MSEFTDHQVRVLKVMAWEHERVERQRMIKKQIEDFCNTHTYVLGAFRHAGISATTLLDDLTDWIIKQPWFKPEDKPSG